MLMLFEQILNGLLVGSYYTLLALGLSIIFSLGGVVNLAHGAFYAVGAYLTVLFTDILGFGLAFLITPAVVGLIGIAIEALFLRRLYNKDPILTLLFTFGLAMSGEQALRLIFGASGIPFSIPEFCRVSYTSVIFYIHTTACQFWRSPAYQLQGCGYYLIRPPLA